MNNKENYKSEAKLQADCIIWFKNNHVELSQRMWATMNEGRDVTLKLAMGMTPGVSDILYYGEDDHLYGFELKLPGAVHSINHLKKQAKWMVDVLGDRGFFVDSFEAFKKACGGCGQDSDTSECIPAKVVYDFCCKCKQKTITWRHDGFSVTEKEK